jgi:hypothetical protein
MRCVRYNLFTPKQRAVAVAQKTVIMLQGMLVYVFPIVANESRYENQQGTFRLMEIRDDGISNPYFKGGSN